jgi:deazaflavin-dependent oxidoreductase (nitroreductase family)
MDSQPNAIQRFFHRVAALRPVSRLLSRILQPADDFILFITRGKHTFAELLLPTIVVETIGARSGQRRTHPLGGFLDGDKYILVGSNFGSQHHPAWVYNLRAHPECVVHAHGSTGNYIAREVEGELREKYRQLAISYYHAYEIYEQRAAPRKISVWILELRD